MRKRFPALILSLAFLLCVPVRAAAPRLEVHLPESPVEAGENFTVTVDLTGNPGVHTIQFTLAFDRERMECVQAELGAMLAGADIGKANPDASAGAIIAAASLEAFTGDGPVGIFRFQAKERLSDFHFSIEKITLGDQDGKKLDVSVTNAQPSGDSGANESASGGNSASVTPKPDSGANESGNGGGASVTPKPDSGASNSASGGNGANVTPKPDSGANDSGNGASASVTPKPDSGASDSGRTETASGGADKPSASPPFTDIAGTWAESYIRTATERNLFQGYADGTFRPNNRLTRAQFMMVLWNLAGRPEASKESPFTDMQGQIENFRKAVAWAYEKGFVNGTSATTFSPGEPLTRQAAMKILFAYHGGGRGAEVLLTDAYESIFTDSGLISAWARDAMYWAVYQTILSGSTPSTLNPGGIVTRAQLAAIMVRYTDRFPA